MTVQRSSLRRGLSSAMEKALTMLAQARDEGRYPHGIAANTLDEPYLMDGQVWMDLRTAAALQRRGLVRVESAAEVFLKDTDSDVLDGAGR